MMWMLVKLFTVISVLVIAFFFGQNIPFTEQKEVLDSLKDIAAIVFGVMGAWIAIIYPEMLSSVVQTRKVSENASLRRLLEPMIYSAVVVCVIVVIALAGPIIKQFDFILAHKVVLRGVLYSIICLLALVLLGTMVLALLPGEVLEDKLSRAGGRKRLITRLGSRHQQK
jgi:hypothetical protein